MENSVKTIQRLLALGTTAVVIASLACNSSPPGGKSSRSASNNVTQTPPVTTDPGLTPTPIIVPISVAGSLQLTMAPAALTGNAFEVDVSFRDTSGNLISSTDVVTLSLATTPVTGATLGGTLSKAAVNGVAAFTDLTLASVGSGYVIGASSSQATVTTTAIKSSPFKVAYSEDDNLSVGGVANTSTSTAQVISPNVPVFGKLGAGEVHYYKLNATVGQWVSIYGYSNRTDLGNWDTSLRLQLIGPDGATVIARSGAISPDANAVDTSAQAYIPATGTYYVKADQDQAGFSSGKFGLLMSFFTPPSGTLQLETEGAGVTGKNDTISTAQALTAGYVYGHYDNTATNTSTADYYKITTSGVTKVHLELLGSRVGFSGANPVWDGVISLQDSAGNQLQRSDNSAFLDPVIDYVVTTAGTYYVRVTRAEYSTNTANAAYFLQYTPATITSTTLAATASNTTATAPLAAYGTEYRGSFTAGGTQYVAFNGTVGDVVRFVLEDSQALQNATATANPNTVPNTINASGPTTGDIASPAPPPDQVVLIAPDPSPVPQPVPVIQGTPSSGTTTSSATMTSTSPTSTSSTSAAAPGGPVMVIGPDPTMPIPVAPPPSGLDAVLLGTDGVTALAQGISNGDPTDFKLNTRQTILQATGKYFVKITNTAAGTFGFRIEKVSGTTREVEPNDTAATGTVIPVAGWASGAISSSTDKDHFKVHAEANQLVTVGVLAASGGGIGTSTGDWGSSLVPVIEVRDASGNLVAATGADRKGLTNFAESMLHPELMTETSFRAPAGADYDVTVSDADSQGGAKYFYALHVWKNQ